MEEYKSLIATQRQYYSDGLRKRAQDTKKFASLFDEVPNNAADLRSPLFWRIATKVAVSEAKLFGRKRSVPDRYFENILARYLQWRDGAIRVSHQRLRANQMGGLKTWGSSQAPGFLEPRQRYKDIARQYGLRSHGKPASRQHFRLQAYE